MLNPLSAKLASLLRGRSSKGGIKGNGRFAVATSVGTVRQRNEDRAAILRARFGHSPDRDFNLAVVCDGLGGMEGGQEAAALGTSRFISSFLNHDGLPAISRLATALSDANNSIYQLLAGRGGTTLTAVLVTRSGASFLCHVGDSRLFAIQPGRKIRQISRDDTFDAYLNRPNDVERRDTRLLQFVGMGDEVEPQITTLHGELPATSFLVTTDGAHDVPEAILSRIVAAAGSPLDLARKLIQLSEMLGGVDNATAAILPSEIDDDVSDSPGITLSFTLPSEELEVWLQPDALLRSDDPRAITKRSPDVKASEPLPPKGTPVPSKPDRPKRQRKPSGVRKKPSEKELPLIAERPGDVEVRFPGNEEVEGS